MYDITVDLQEFYDTHVRLGQAQRDQLAGYRETNIERIKSGLDDLAAETGQPRPYPYDVKNQGGYAMHTLNQAADNDYDIDVALLFEKDSLPDDPVAARQRVRDALLKRAGGFATEPEARTNAVTVWYEEGYHIDFAIYRRKRDWWEGDIIEHASTEWTRRDPMQFTDWFFQRVDDTSPKADWFNDDPKVAKGQMRRIVRFLKWHCRSRTSWSLPGGMVMSILVAETYRPNRDRDDVSLYETLKALSERLNSSTVVYNPVDNSHELTARPDVKKQVERLKDQIPKTLARLAVLFEPGCTRQQARSAWDWVFNHNFWAKKESAEEAEIKAYPGMVVIRCGLSKRKNWPTYKDYPSGSFVLPKGLALKFTVASTNVKPPYTVRWQCINEGPEAADEGQMRWERAEKTCWTSTKFKGTQKMLCYIDKDGRALARATHVVKISEDGWRNADA